MRQTKLVHSTYGQHLHSILKIGTTKFHSDFSLLVNETRAHISHSK